ncbi:hypothetical protein LTR36_008315 [Oleoguttula mirabilis]|uniref:TAFII28-like protein domain-containing protein n=1 Tax=Oleoguttula mirabilis TaxID=1507867 RepID=A0AAV9J7V1_9PEZI|nr:hypothetical protein LTR36_008315 [Oleoguttula mirabilis]
MASPPSYGGRTSPPGPHSLALPKQRPTLALPTALPSRKPSNASNPSSAHPLRQTSFPPSDSLEAQHALAEDGILRQYSPSAADSLEFSDDNDIRSAISGPTGAGDDGNAVKKRKRGEKRPRGRPAKNPPGLRAGSMSVANGEEGRSGPSNKRGATAGAHSVLTADDADAEADDDDDEDDAAGGANGITGRVPLYEGGQMSAEQLADERERKRVFYDAVPEEHRARLASFQRSKLKTADVRRLVNQVLGQSVPQNVVLVVSAYAKMFAGMVVEEARGVQGEWTAVEERGGGNGALERVRGAKRARREVEEGGDADGAADGVRDGRAGSNAGAVKPEPTSPNYTQPFTNGTAHPDHDREPAKSDELHPGGAGGLQPDVEECDRGPLLPDHLREALRRYKKRRSGGPVGFTGLSLEGRENTAPRMGGRRLFR